MIGDTLLDPEQIPNLLDQASSSLELVIKSCYTIQNRRIFALFISVVEFE